MGSLFTFTISGWLMWNAGGTYNGDVWNPSLVCGPADKWAHLTLVFTETSATILSEWGYQFVASYPTYGPHLPVINPFINGGYYDDLLIFPYAQALTSSQVSTLYNSGFLGICICPGTLRFAGGDGAKRRSGRRIFGTRPKGRTARTGRSVAHTLRCLYQRRRLKRRVSEGGSGEVQARPRERRSGTDRDDDQKDPSSGRRRGGVSQRDSESDARAR